MKNSFHGRKTNKVTVAVDKLAAALTSFNKYVWPCCEDFSKRRSGLALDLYSFKTAINRICAIHAKCIIAGNDALLRSLLLLLNMILSFVPTRK